MYTLKELQKAVQQCYNIHQVCQYLGIAAYGGSYLTVKKRIQQLHLDTSHFRSVNKKRGVMKSLPLDIILTNGSYYKCTNHLKDRLLKQGVFEYKCYQCGQSTFKNKDGDIVAIPLQIHHIDGDRSNNSIENLTLLCPTCHSLTTNFRGKNRKDKSYMKCSDCGKRIRKNKYGLCRECYIKKNYSSYCIEDTFGNKKYVYKEKCKSCGENIVTKSKSGLCRECYNKTMINVNKPSKEELQKLIQQHSFLELGRMFNLSDNAIRKWCKNYGIDYHILSIRPESLKGLAKGRETLAYRSKLKKTCPICGRQKHEQADICRTCYLEQCLKEKQEKYKKLQQENNQQQE